MNRTIRAIVVAVVALTVGVITATPAVAYKTAYYRWLTCPEGTATTGSITSASTLTQEVEGNIYYMHGVFLDGTLAPCRRTNDDVTVFGLGAYRSSDAYGQPVTYLLHDTPTYPYATSIRVYPDVQAVCLITDETTRLACVSVVWVDAGYSMVPVIEGPLAVDSPRVAMPAVTKLSFIVGGPVPPSCFKCP